MPDNKIGYIINETGYKMEFIDTKPTNSIKNHKFYNPNRLAATGILQTGNMKIEMVEYIEQKI